MYSGDEEQDSIDAAGFEFSSLKTVGSDVSSNILNFCASGK